MKKISWLTLTIAGWILVFLKEGTSALVCFVGALILLNLKDK